MNRCTAVKGSSGDAKASESSKKSDHKNDKFPNDIPQNRIIYALFANCRESPIRAFGKSPPLLSVDARGGEATTMYVASLHFPLDGIPKHFRFFPTCKVIYDIEWVGGSVQG